MQNQSAQTQQQLLLQIRLNPSAVLPHHQAIHNNLQQHLQLPQLGVNVAQAAQGSVVGPVGVQGAGRA